MDLMIIIAIIVTVTLSIVLALLIRGLAGNSKNLPLSADWIEELSIERYRPMMKLLDGGDIEFLRSQPGFTPEMASKLRVQRANMFRGYLRSLESDFGRVCGAMKLLMVHSKSDRPDLASAMMRNQLKFASGMMEVRFRLALYRWGLCNVDVASLISLFDGVRGELRTLVPSAMGSAA